MRYLMVELSETPLDPEEFLEDSIILENNEFVPGIAESVVTLNLAERKEMLADFLEYFPEDLRDYDPEEESIVFREGFSRHYFKERFEKFKKESAELTFDDFIDPFGGRIFAMRMLLTQKYDHYIYTDMTYAPMDSFIRALEPGQKYYFGGFLGFKC